MRENPVLQPLGHTCALSQRQRFFRLIVYVLHIFSSLSLSSGLLFELIDLGGESVNVCLEFLMVSGECVMACLEIVIVNLEIAIVCLEIVKGRLKIVIVCPKPVL
jgi:hypothetical protein